MPNSVTIRILLGKGKKNVRGGGGGEGGSLATLMGVKNDVFFGLKKN